MKAMESAKVVLIGNPNCGKTTLFNQITGLNKKTGNWTGVTVDSQYCSVSYDQQNYDLVDLPGVYALSIDGVGQDEQHVQDYLKNFPPDLIINVINSSSLERGLFLNVELLEYDIPVITVLNMWDEAIDQGLNIDVKQLSEQLGCLVIPLIAKSGFGVNDLKTLINNCLQNRPETKILDIKYPKSVTDCLSTDSKNSKAIQIQNAYVSLQDSEKELFDEEVFSSRFQTAHEITKSVLIQDEGVKKASNKLDLLTTHPIWGMGVFFLAMYLMFFFAINVSAVFVDFFDLSAQALLIDGGHQFFSYLSFPEWLSTILADGIGGGIQTVATFIPVIGFLYLVLTWFEDSGYMSRAAFVMNGLMQKLGLSGQSFVPLIVSFGCNVPAIAATRALPSRREKLVTIMMAPFMSCGARLSVYALFVAAFFTDNAALIVFSLYLFGIIIAILTGVFLRKTLLPGEPEPFLIELPPWRVPTFNNLIKGTWNRLKGFLVDAGKIIIIMVMVIQILSSLGKDLSWGNQDSENSVLSVTAKVAIPVFEPMGIEEKNWPAVVGILTGVLAKEVVVGTLDAIYTSMDSSDQEVQSPASVSEGLIDAVVSIKDNALALGDMLMDPLGLSLTQTGSIEEMADRQDVSKPLFGIIYEKFGSLWAAYSYLLFILLYFPCVAATAAIAREAGMKWAIFSAAWSTGLAYMIATSFYQAGQWGSQPVFSGSWIGGCGLILIGFYLSLKHWANAEKA